MTRTDYFNDPNAPKPNALVPAASAIVRDSAGRILLIRRSDNDLWSIPGGSMEIGESVSEAAVREVREETGLEVRPLRVVGIYSDPRNVVAYEDGEVRQQFSICFVCEAVGGELQTSKESTDVEFFSPEEVASMNLGVAIRLRIDDFLKDSLEASFD